MTSALLWLLLLSAPVPAVCTTDTDCARYGGNGDPEPMECPASDPECDRDDGLEPDEIQYR